MANLYIIHGWTYTIQPWTTTLQTLKDAGFSVKMLKVPGLTEPSDKVWTIDDYVKWANQNIPDHAIALGHSNGGRILLNLCEQNPNKLKHLILLDAAGVYEPSHKKQIIESIAKIGKPLKQIPLIDKAFHKLTGSTDYSKAPQNMKTTLQNMLESDKNLKINTITTPTNILWGKNDTVTPPRQAQILNEQLPNSELKIYPNWTHAPYISHPKELASAIEKLLTELKK